MQDSWDVSDVNVDAIRTQALSGNEMRALSRSDGFRIILTPSITRQIRTIKAAAKRHNKRWLIVMFTFRRFAA